MSISKTMKGEYACLKLDERSVEREIVTSKPIFDCPYDRIVDYEGKLHRVQVKYTDSGSRNASGSVVANIRKTGSDRNRSTKYMESEIDAIVVYVAKIDAICWFPKEIWVGKSALTIRLEETKNGQTKGCLMAKDYVW